MPKKSFVSPKISEIKISNPKTEGYALRWINIIDAGKNEIDYLSHEYDFNLKHLQASAGDVFAQRPMVEVENGYVFMILHFPTLKNERIIAGEIEFFIGHGYLVTVHNNNLETLKDFFDYCKKNPDTLLSYNNESSAILLYEILNRLIRDCYHLIDHNSIKINEAEEIIFEGSQDQAVSQILNLRRNIINIRKIMQNHKNILKKLQEMESSLVPRELIKKNYEILIEHSKRIWEMLDNQKEMVEVLNDTNESLLNSKTNNIIKTLTIFSVIVIPLNLIAFIFGINAKGMPFVDNPFGFWIIISIMAIAFLIMLSIFSRKHWL
jgi:magnesium transporter